jgi:hypothetical protein
MAEDKEVKRKSLSSLSPLIQKAVEKSKTVVRTRKKIYSLYLNQDVVEAVREKGFQLSPLVDNLLSEALIELSGPNRLQVLALVNPGFREHVEFARKNMDKWEDPQRKEWWDNWFRETAQQFGVGAEELRKFCQG